MTRLKAILDWIIATVTKVKIPTGLPAWVGGAWKWVSWAIVGLVTSIYNFFISPKVWPAAALFFAIGWIASFNFGQRHPEEPQQVARLAGTTVDLDVCRTQQSNTNQRLDMALAEIAGLKERLAKSEAALKEKPKTVVRYRTAPAKKPKQTDTGFSISWPKF